MATYPLFLELKARPCLVIGGGPVAFRKASALLACGARVTVVAPELSAGLRKLVRARKARWKPRRFRAGDLAGVELAVAATEDEEVNRFAAQEARRRRVWINVADRPTLCSFILPSVVRRGKLVLAISTSGASPALAKWIRKDLQIRYGPELSRLLSGAAVARRKVQERVRSAAARKRLFETALKAYLQVLKPPPIQPPKI